MITDFKRRLLSRACMLTLVLTPAFAHAQAQPAGAEEDVVEAVTVTSQRAADQKAVDEKRAANTLIDSIVATDVGKLPDQNVAEALRRLPALSVANDQGEGRYVVIRGVNPNLANVTVNGATAAVPEPEGRQIKLDDVPSSLIGKVDVIKSLTPDRDANAIAGQIDIDTLSAFDRGKPFLYVRGADGRYDINGKHPYEGDATVGGKFGPDNQFGVVFSANYSKRPIESQNFGSSGPVFSVVNGINFPNLEEFRDYNLIRTRKGMTANLDWRPKDGVKLYLRTLHSEFSDAENRDRFRISAPTAITPSLANVAIGTLKARGIAYVRSRTEDDNTTSLLAGGVFKLPIGELTAEIGNSRAEKDDPLRSEVQYQTAANALTVNYDVTEALYQWTPSANFFDPAAYSSFSSVNFDRRKAVDTLNQGRVDWKIPVSFGDNSELKFGAKLMDRRKVNDRGYLTYTGGATPPPLTAVTAPPQHATVYDGRYTLGPPVNYNKFIAYITANPSSIAVNIPGSIANSLAVDYDATEKVYAGYGMATLNFGDWTVIPGVRVEHTKGDYKAKTITAASTLSQGYNAFGDFDYTDVFPGVNAKWSISQNLLFRAGLTTAIGRPNFSDLAPYVNVDTSGTGTVSLGNPNLQPLKSVNGDLALEYYLPGHGILSVSAFAKDIDKPIFTTVRGSRSGETFAGLSLPLAVVTQPQNAAKAKVTGLEFNLQKQLIELPAPFDGLGVSANIAITNGTATGVPGRSGGVPLDRQSERTGSAQIYYEKAGFQARLAYSFRSKYLLLLGSTPAGDNIVDGYNSLDARLAYTLKAVTVSLEGSNLTDEPYRIYLGSRPQVIENERYGASYRLGVQLAF